MDDDAEVVGVTVLDPEIYELENERRNSQRGRTFLRSSTVRVRDSPVVPQTKTPVTFWSTTILAWVSTRSKLTERSSFMGVWTAQQRPWRVKVLGSLGSFLPYYRNVR